MTAASGVHVVGRVMVHIHWASHARNQWSHARLHIFPGKKLNGIHKYTVFFNHILIVYVRNYHNKVKKYCLEAMHEITDFVHEMFSVCVPLHFPCSCCPINMLHFNKKIFIKKMQYIFKLKAWLSKRAAIFVRFAVLVLVRIARNKIWNDKFLLEVHK